MAELPAIPQDVNRDDVVNILDLVLVASDLGDEGADLAADINGDEVVNILDLVLVAGAFGNVQRRLAVRSTGTGNVDGGRRGAVVGSSANPRFDGCSVAGGRSCLGATSGGAGSERDDTPAELSEPV